MSIIPVLLIQGVQEAHLNAQSIVAGAVISIQAQPSLTPQRNNLFPEQNSTHSTEESRALAICQRPEAESDTVTQQW